MHDQLDDFLGGGTVVDQADVLAGVLGEHRVDLQRVRVGVQRDARAVLPHGGALAHELDQLDLGGARGAAVDAEPLHVDDDRLRADARTLQAHVAARFYEHFFSTKVRNICNKTITSTSATSYTQIFGVFLGEI